MRFTIIERKFQPLFDDLKMDFADSFRNRGLPCSFHF